MSVENFKVKFSPFQALLIGEKNKIARKQSVSGKSLITELMKQKKRINLRYLFDLDKKRPQSHQKICKFFKKRIQKNRLALFKAQRRVDKKVKFKPDFKFKETLEEKIVNKIHSRTRGRPQNNSTMVPSNMSPRVVLVDIMKVHLWSKKFHFSDSDSKFVAKYIYRTISERKQYLRQYLHLLYLQKNREVFNNREPSINLPDDDHEASCSVVDETSRSPGPKEQFDVFAPECILDEISKKYHEGISADETEHDVFAPECVRDEKPREYRKVISPEVEETHVSALECVQDETLNELREELVVESESEVFTQERVRDEISKKCHENVAADEYEPEAFEPDCVRDQRPREYHEVINSDEDESNSFVIDVQDETSNLHRQEIVVVKNEPDVFVLERVWDELLNEYNEVVIEENKFEFPQYPKGLGQSDFGDNLILMDFVYEVHPMWFDFGSQDDSEDYEDALYRMEYNGFSRKVCMNTNMNTVIEISDDDSDSDYDSEVQCLFESKIVPYVDLEEDTVDAVKLIDECSTEDSQLISAAFVKDAKGTNILLDNLFKPIFYDCPFGILPGV